MVYGKPAILAEGIPVAGDRVTSRLPCSARPAFPAGQAKNTYGTGCFMLMNTGDKRIPSKHGLLTTIAWGVDGKVDYALEGSIFVAGAAVQWLRDELKLIDNAAQSEAMARPFRIPTASTWCRRSSDWGRLTGTCMRAAPSSV